MPGPVRGAVDRLANSRDRSTEHLLVGLGLTAAAVLGSALVARLNAPERAAPAEEERGSPALSLVWPPLFLALTVSGLRIWNAPKSPARSQALTLWGAVQALNALWLALSPRGLAARLAAAAAAVGAALGYLSRARRVDPPAARLVAPYAGWIGLAGAVTEELWRKTPPSPTIH